MVEVLVCCLSLYTEYLNCEAKQQMVYQPSMVIVFIIIIIIIIIVVVVIIIGVPQL